MKKALGLTIAVYLALACNAAYATQASSASLGPAAIFSPEEGGAWLYPAEVNNCQKTLYFEMDTASYKKGNMTFLGLWSDQLRKYGTWGAGLSDLYDQKYFELVIPAINAAIANNPLMSPRNGIPLPGNSYHLFYARDVGPLICGLHLSRGTGDKSWSFRDTIPQDAVERQAGISVWGLEAGVSAIIGDNIYVQSMLGHQTISFSSRFELSGASPPYWEEIADNDAGGTRLGLRLFYGINDRIKIVPVVYFNHFSLGYTAGYGDTLHMPGSLYDGTGGTYRQREFKGSLGAEYRPRKDIKLMGGISLEYTGNDITDSGNVWLRTTNPSRRYLSQEKSTVILPAIQGGLEAGPARWLKLRLGASQRPAKVTTSSEFNNGLRIETSESSSGFGLYFGLGFAFGRLAIDAQLNDDQPFDAGYLISGNPGKPFTRLSLRYFY